MKNNAKYLGLGYIIIGSFFLFNPNINILDLLPDFIGYIFITAGLTKIADINVHIAEARESFIKLVYINLSRLPAFFLMIWITTNKIDERTTVLVLTFSYAVIELIYLLRAFSDLFEGLTYLGSRYDSSTVFHLPKRGEKSSRRARPVSRLASFTTFFMLLKLVLPCIPYLIYLRVDNPFGAVPSGNYNLERYKNPLIVLTAGVTLVIGIFWVYRFARYIKHVICDTHFVDQITNAYKTEVLSRDGYLTKRGIKTVVIIFCIAYGLSPDFFVSDISLIPDFAAAVFFFIGALMLVKYTSRAKPLIALSAVYFLSSIASYATSIHFVDNFAYEILHKSSAARMAYRVLLALTTLEAAILCAMLFLLARAFSDVAHKHTGYKGDAINELSGTHMPVTKLLSRRIYISFGYGAAAAVGSILYVVLKSRTTSVFVESAYAEPGYVYLPEIELLWLYYLLLSLVWVLYSIRVLRQLASETEQKYRYS